MSVTTDGKKASKVTKVQQWLDSIPDGEQASVELGDLHLNLETVDAFEIKNLAYLNKMMYGRNKAIGTTKQTGMFLQGCQCQINESSSKHTPPTGVNESGLKKVTFKLAEDEIVDVTGPVVKDETSQTAARKTVMEDRYALHRGMFEYLKEVAKKRDGNQNVRSTKYITTCVNVTNDSRATDDHSENDEHDRKERQDGKGLVLEQDGFDGIICVGRQKKGTHKTKELSTKPCLFHIDAPPVTTVSRMKFPIFGPKTLQLPRKISVNRRESEKPLLKGLVVDSAFNQQPSIVRASKNANLREEHALKIRIGGYKNECSQNINNIRIAQRKLTANLAHLKSKMAEKSVKRAQSARGVDEVKMKAGHDIYRNNMAHLCFPPLVYRNRRALTVS